MIKGQKLEIKKKKSTYIHIPEALWHPQHKYFHHRKWWAAVAVAVPGGGGDGRNFGLGLFH